MMLFRAISSRTVWIRHKGILYLAALVLVTIFQGLATGAETHFKLAIANSPQIQPVKMDLQIEKNATLRFNAQGAEVDGDAIVKIFESVRIESGEFAGWGYGIGRYMIGKYKGSLYMVFHDDKVLGQVQGDLYGTLESKDGVSSMTWQISRVAEKDAGYTVNLTVLNRKPGSLQKHDKVMTLVLKDLQVRQNGTPLGQNKGAYSQISTSIYIPSADGDIHNFRRHRGVGFEFGTYQSDQGRGVLWTVLDNTKNYDPFCQSRFGAMSGALAGAVEVIYSFPVKEGSAIEATTVHALK